MSHDEPQKTDPKKEAGADMPGVEAGHYEHPPELDLARVGDDPAAQDLKVL